MPLQQVTRFTPLEKTQCTAFFFSSSFTAWVPALAVLATQTLCFVFFINAASLDFGADTVWKYSFSCPRDSEVCRSDSDVSRVGWFFFTLFGVIHLTPDMLNGLKLVWGASKHGFTKKGLHIFIGGCFLFTITALALYATVVFNVATSRSDVEMIFNTVVLLFVNDLDEKMFTSLHTINSEWLEKITSEIAGSFRGNIKVDIQYAAANHELRDEQTRRIEQIEKKLLEKIMRVETEYEKLKTEYNKLKTEVKGLKARHTTKSIKIKTIQHTTKNIKIKTIQAIVIAENKKLQERSSRLRNRASNKEQG